MKLYAKSARNGSVELREHLMAVGQMARKLAGPFGMDPNLAYWGGLLHDIGKAHPFFQRVSLGGERHEAKHMRLFGSRPPFRHEISSLAFLPFFEKAMWAPLTEMIIGHHKSIEAERGILGLIEEKPPQWVKALHLSQWSEWSPQATDILHSFGLDKWEISLEKAEESLDWVIQYCEELNRGWSPWRGLLMAADHFISATDGLSPANEPKLFKIPELHCFDRPYELYPLSLKRSDQAERHSLVLAPTGAGKTDYLMRRCRQRVFYVLPFQASINAMYERFKEVMPNEEIRLQHGASRLEELEKGDEYAAAIQSFTGASVKVMTPFQMASLVLGTAGFEAQILDLRGMDVILDEIHTYSQAAQAIVLALVQRLARLGCRVHIGTATMPSLLYEKLLETLKQEGGVAEVSLTHEELKSYRRHTVHKITRDEWPGVLKQGIEVGEKVLLVFNTVAAAQDAFQLIQNKPEYQEIDKMLIHSRFKRGDRALREKQLMRMAAATEPCILVSTQVVEVSLDISFDRMITEAAPIDSLIQRFGRINRKRTRKPLLKPVYVLEPGTKVLPYKREIIAKTFSLLPHNQVLEVTELQAMIDQVYPELDLQKLDTHIAWKGDQFRYTKLTNIAKSPLMELLEMDADVCILGSDEEQYINGSWVERTKLEIPVNGRSLRRYKSHYRRLEETGNSPLVIDEAEVIENYTHLGLCLQEPNSFL